MWHDEADTAHVTLTRDGHKEHWSMGRGGQFRKWLAKRFYESTGKVLEPVCKGRIIVSACQQSLRSMRWIMAARIMVSAISGSVS